MQANLGLIRPAPTPFDAQTAVTADAILGSLKEEIDAISGISAKIIGSGLYLSSANAFNVEVVEVRAATDEEISHGHAHGPGGVQH